MTSKNLDLLQLKVSRGNIDNNCSVKRNSFIAFIYRTMWEWASVQWTNQYYTYSSGVGYPYSISVARKIFSADCFLLVFGWCPLLRLMSMAFKWPKPNLNCYQSIFSLLRCSLQAIVIFISSSPLMVSSIQDIIITTETRCLLFILVS